MAGRSRTPENSGTMTAKVAETLDNLELAPEDAAVAALALKYAETIDRAVAIAAAAAKIPYDPDVAEQVEKLKQRVGAHATMADLGPKLLAALDALSATPKARSAVMKPGKPPAGTSQLQMLRAGRLA